jgi:hypothetical protein
MDKSVTHLLEQVEKGKKDAGKNPALVKVGAGCKQVSRGVAESAEKP